jgi:hypothetical protein
MITEEEAIEAMKQLSDGLSVEQMELLDTFISFAISKCTSEVMKQMNENLAELAAKQKADSV